MSQQWWQSSSRFYRLWSGVGFLTAVGDSLAGLLEGMGVLSMWRTRNEVTSLKAALNAYYAENYPCPTDGNEEDGLRTFILDPTPLSGESTLFALSGKPTPEEQKNRLKEYGQQVVQALQSEDSISFFLSPYRDFYMSLMEQDNICHLNFQALSLVQNTRKKFYAFLSHVLWVNPNITYLSLNQTEQAFIERDAPEIVEQLAYNQRYRAMQALSTQSRTAFPFSERALNVWKTQELQPSTEISQGILIALVNILGESSDEKIAIPQLNEKIKQATTIQAKDKTNETLSFYHSLCFMSFQLTQTLQQITDWISPPTRTSSQGTRRADLNESALVTRPKTGWSFSNLWRQCFSSSRDSLSSSDGHRSSSSDAQQTLIAKPKAPETIGEMEAYLRELPVKLLVPRKKDKAVNLAQCQAEVARILAIDAQYQQGEIQIEERNGRILYEGLIKHGFRYDFSFAFEALEFSEVMQLKRYLEGKRELSKITSRISEEDKPESRALWNIHRPEREIICSLLYKNKGEEEQALLKKIQDAGRDYTLLFLKPEEIRLIQKILLRAPEDIISEEKALLLRRKFVEYYKTLELNCVHIDELKDILAVENDLSLRNLGKKIVFNVHKKLLTTKQSFCHPDTVREHAHLQPDFQRATAILSDLSEWADTEIEGKRYALDRLSEMALHAEGYQSILNREASYARGKKLDEGIIEGVKCMDKKLNDCRQDHDKLVKMRKALERHVNKKSGMKEQITHNDGTDTSDSHSSQGSLSSAGSTESLGDAQQQQRLSVSVTTLSRNPSLSAIYSGEQKDSTEIAILQDQDLQQNTLVV